MKGVLIMTCNGNVGGTGYSQIALDNSMVWCTPGGGMTLSKAESNALRELKNKKAANQKLTYKEQQMYDNLQTKEVSTSAAKQLKQKDTEQKSTKSNSIFQTLAKGVKESGLFPEAQQASKKHK